MSWVLLILHFLSQTNSKDGELDDKFQSLSLNNNEKKADTPIEEVIIKCVAMLNYFLVKV